MPSLSTIQAELLQICQYLLTNYLLTSAFFYAVIYGGVIGVVVIVYIYWTSLKSFCNCVIELPLYWLSAIIAVVATIFFGIIIGIFSGVFFDSALSAEITFSLPTVAFFLIILTFGILFIFLQLVGSTCRNFVKKFKQQLSKIEKGNLSPGMPVEGPAEIQSLAEQFNRTVDSVKKTKKSASVMERYVSKSIIHSLKADSRSFESMEAERQTCSIMFADIRNFSYVSQEVTGKKLIELLNTYFEIVVEEVRSTNGVIDKFIGDAVLAVWGAPEFSWSSSEPMSDYTYRAVQTAVQIQKRIFEFNKKRSDDQYKLSFGIGIATGKVLTGHLGTKNRADWSVIGENVNLASRISDTTLPYRVLISAKTFYMLDLNIPTRELETITLKGFDLPITLYAILWHDGRTGPLMVEEQMKHNWYLWVEGEKKGPLHLTELFEHSAFSLDARVAQPNIDGWHPWVEVAKDLRVWMIKTPAGISGPFQFQKVKKKNKELDMEVKVRVRGETTWYPIEHFW